MKKHKGKYLTFITKALLAWSLCFIVFLGSTSASAQEESFSSYSCKELNARYLKYKKSFHINLIDNGSDKLWCYSKYRSFLTKIIEALSIIEDLSIENIFEFNFYNYLEDKILAITAGGYSKSGTLAVYSKKSKKLIFKRNSFDLEAAQLAGAIIHEASHALFDHVRCPSQSPDERPRCDQRLESISNWQQGSTFTYHIAFLKALYHHPDFSGYQPSAVEEMKALLNGKAFYEPIEKAILEEWKVP